MASAKLTNVRIYLDRSYCNTLQPFGYAKFIPIQISVVWKVFEKGRHTIEKAFHQSSVEESANWNAIKPCDVLQYYRLVSIVARYS